MPYRSKSLSCSSRQSGRVLALVAGTLALVAGLWLGAGAVKEPAPEPAMAAAMSEADAELAHATERASAAIEELQVTAPRLDTPRVTFEQPTLDVALGEPESPKQYWQNSES